VLFSYISLYFKGIKAYHNLQLTLFTCPVQFANFYPKIANCYEFCYELSEKKCKMSFNIKQYRKVCFCVILYNS